MADAAPSGGLAASRAVRRNASGAFLRRGLVGDPPPASPTTPPTQFEQEAILSSRSLAKSASLLAAVTLICVVSVVLSDPAGVALCDASRAWLAQWQCRCCLPCRSPCQWAWGRRWSCR